MSRANVGIIMGSQSDLKIMREAAQVLEELDISFELTVVSAHRTPERMFDYAKSARARGLQVIIAGAGGAAHLPGMVAAITSLPVIGVPIKIEKQHRWLGLRTIHFTDASRSAGCHSSFRWGTQCRYTGGPNCRLSGPANWRQVR